MYSHYLHAISIVCQSIRSNNGSNCANCGRLLSANDLSVAVRELRRGGLAALVHQDDVPGQSIQLGVKDGSTIGRYREACGFASRARL
jgi:hypothetical protein